MCTSVTSLGRQPVQTELTLMTEYFLPNDEVGEHKSATLKAHITEAVARCRESRTDSVYSSPLSPASTRVDFCQTSSTPFPNFC